MQFYSDESRANDKWSLPDCEVFELTAEEAAELGDYETVGAGAVSGGWFYRYCFPGCLPESPPFGPFESRDAAIADARANAG